MEEGTTPSFDVSFDEAHNWSVSLIEGFEGEQASVGLAVASLILTAGRLMAISEMSPQEEAKFVADFINLLGAYFAKEVH